MQLTIDEKIENRPEFLFDSNNCRSTDNA